MHVQPRTVFHVERVHRGIPCAWPRPHFPIESALRLETLRGGGEKRLFFSFLKGICRYFDSWRRTVCQHVARVERDRNNVNLKDTILDNTAIKITRRVHSIRSSLIGDMNTKKKKKESLVRV